MAVKLIIRIRQLFPSAIVVPFNVLCWKKVHIPIVNRLTLNNHMHNGSRRLLIAKYVALPRKRSVENPLIHTNNNEMNNKMTNAARKPCFFILSETERMIFAGLFTILKKAKMNTNIPKTREAIMASRFSEYPNKTAVFWSAGRTRS